MEAVSHERATEDLAAHLAPVFDSSPDGVYVRLDEEHWICNQRLASIFGYGSPAELNNTPNLLQRLVHEGDQGVVSFCLVETDMIPLTFAGHTFAYHFVRRAD